MKALYVHYRGWGEASRVTRAHLLELARREGIRPQVASRVLERLAARAGVLEDRLRQLPVRQATVSRIVGRVNANRDAWVEDN